MMIDRYTKAVLTVIAACLLWLCAMGGARPLLAQQPPPEAPRLTGAAQPVVIVGTGTMDTQGRVTVNFTQQSGAPRTEPTLPVQLPYTTARPLPVSLPYDTAHPLAAELSNSVANPLPVTVAAVKRVGDWDPLRTQVEDAGTRKTPGGGGRR